MLPLKAIISDEGRFVSLNILMDHIEHLLLHGFGGNNYKKITFLYLLGVQTTQVHMHMYMLIYVSMCTIP